MSKNDSISRLLKGLATTRGSFNVLLGVEQHEGQVQHNGEPVSINHEEEGQERVDSGFGDDVGVKAVAKVDGVDVVAGGGKTEKCQLVFGRSIRGPKGVARNI
jgi:hypothetical protein